MRRKYTDCIRPDSNCAECSLVSHGRDCHGINIGKVEWRRKVLGMTQAQLSEATGINDRVIRKIEAGEIDVGNITLSNALKLADALEMETRDLIGG